MYCGLTEVQGTLSSLVFRPHHTFTGFTSRNLQSQKRSTPGSAKEEVTIAILFKAFYPLGERKFPTSDSSSQPFIELKLTERLAFFIKIQNLPLLPYFSTVSAELQDKSNYKHTVLLKRVL